MRRPELDRLVTERGLPALREIDRWPMPRRVRELIRAQDVAPALLARRSEIARLAAWAAETLSCGGRIFLVGAGTSGRLGVLEAAECPPTFGTEPSRIQGVLAGGRRALVRSSEKKEDLPSEGRQEMARRRVRRGDLVVGIAASGTTPFVQGALRVARIRGARTALVAFNRVPPDARGADLVLEIDTGAEPIGGSTRMRAGTATKILLNTVTTAAMIETGRAFGNRMVAVRPTSHKLRRRAERLVRELAGVSGRKAAPLLRRAGGDVRAAVLVSKGMRPREAKALLASCGGSLRKALAKCNGGWE